MFSDYDEKLDFKFSSLIQIVKGHENAVII